MIKNFLFSPLSRPAFGLIQPGIEWVPGALSPGMKRPGRETDDSPSTSAEVKIMHTDNFTDFHLNIYHKNSSLVCLCVIPECDRRWQLRDAWVPIPVTE
jgi:hypothetical protein